MNKKVAFIALTNSSFNKENLMERFFSKEHSDKYNLYIHNKNPILSDFFKKFEIPSEYKVETQWGKYSLVLATVRLLMFALQNPENEKFVLISESHCPLYGMQKMHSIIFDRYPILSFSNQPKEESWSLSRLDALIKDKGRNPFDKSHAKFVSQWFVCDRKSAEVFVKNEIKFRKFFNLDKLCFPDEIYFHLMARHFNLPVQYKNNCHFNWYLKSSKYLVNSGHREKPKTYCKITNRTIDVFREKSDCIFFRKIYNGTILDEEYLLQ